MLAVEKCILEGLQDYSYFRNFQVALRESEPLSEGLDKDFRMIRLF